MKCNNCKNKINLNILVAEEWGLTPLLLAVARSANKCAELLFNHGEINYDATDKQGRNMLHLAALAGNHAFLSQICQQLGKYDSKLLHTLANK